MATLTIVTSSSAVKPMTSETPRIRHRCGCGRSSRTTSSSSVVSGSSVTRSPFPRHHGPMRKAVDVTVTGRVQGVSFRAYAEQQAARLGVAGWVRNEPDGSVAVHVEGDADAVDAFVRWAHEGPGLARV